MSEQDFGFTLGRRGAHRLAGRTVLQVVSALADPDAQRATIAVATALAEAGARPLVAAPPGPLVSDLQARGGVWLDFPSDRKNPLAMVLAVRRLRRLIAQEQIDLVHARSRPAGWMSFAATRSAGVPLVTSLTALGPGRSVLRQRYDSVMARGDVVLAGSKFAAAVIASLYPAAADRITLVRPGVDLAPYHAGGIEPARVQAVRRAWSVAPEERIVLLVAPASLWKGHKVLIEAVRMLGERGTPDVRLVLVGESRGGFAREIELAIKTAHLQSRVHRADDCPDMPAALLAASVVVVPSIEAESFGRIAVEAQAVGAPVIVSDLGALPETILAPPEVDNARRTGWRVAPGDPALLADALGEAMALGATGRDSLGRRARRQAEDRFAIERMARETLDAYAAVLDRHAAA